MNSYSGPGVGSVIALLVVGVLFIGVMVVYSGIYKVLQVLVDHQILERFTSKNMSIAHGVPVSYTHLDVYKRQVLFPARDLHIAV